MGAFAASQRIVESLPIIEVLANNVEASDVSGTGTIVNTGIDLYDLAAHRLLFTLIGATGNGQATMRLQWAIGSYDDTDGTATVDASNYVNLSAVDGTVSTLIEAVFDRTDSAAGTAKNAVQELEVGSIYLDRAPSTSATRRAYLRAKITYKQVADTPAPVILVRKAPRYSEKVADQPSFVQTPVVAHDL